MESNNLIKIRELISKHSIIELNPESINDEMNLIDDLGYDSMSFTMLILELENEFNITIDPEVMLFENFSTPKKIYCLLEEEFDSGKLAQ